MDKKPASLKQVLSSYFKNRSNVAFAFLFGSAARGALLSRSDIDVAVYFIPESGELEIEEDVYYAEEDGVWADIDGLTGRETDLLVLNRAPVRVAYTAITEGIELCRNHQSLYWRYILSAGRVFEEYGDFVRSFAEIKGRAQSLSDSDRERLLRILDFLRTEMNDISQFKHINFEEYIGDSVLRRNNERWIENIINALIDVAKIIIASEKQQIPQTYRETLMRLSMVKHFPALLMESLSQTVRLRNILSHEYLDIRFRHIKKFVKDSETTIPEFLRCVEAYLVD